MVLTTDLHRTLQPPCPDCQAWWRETAPDNGVTILSLEHRPGCPLIRELGEAFDSDIIWFAARPLAEELTRPETEAERREAQWLAIGYPRPPAYRTITREEVMN